MVLFGAPLASEDHAGTRLLCGAADARERQKIRGAGSSSVTEYRSRYLRRSQYRRNRRPHLSAMTCAWNIPRSVRPEIEKDAWSRWPIPVRCSQRPRTARFAEGEHSTRSGWIHAQVKGLAERIEVYEVIGAGAAQTRLQAAARRGLTSFVDREVEAEQLRSAQLTCRGGPDRPKWVAIVGEPGVGKSRLLHEFFSFAPSADWRESQFAPLLMAAPFPTCRSPSCSNNISRSTFTTPRDRSARKCRTKCSRWTRHCKTWFRPSLTFSMCWTMIIRSVP